jgi:hypothetical protein
MTSGTSYSPSRRSQEGLRSLSIAVPLMDDIEHEPVLIHGPPAGKRPPGRCSAQEEPVANAIHSRTHLILAANSEPHVFMGTCPLHLSVKRCVQDRPTEFADRIHTSSRCHSKPRRGSRWRRSSAKRGPNFMHHSRRVSWLTSMPRWCSNSWTSR